MTREFDDLRRCFDTASDSFIAKMQESSPNSSDFIEFTEEIEVFGCFFIKYRPLSVENNSFFYCILLPRILMSVLTLLGAPRDSDQPCQ